MKNLPAQRHCLRKRESSRGTYENLHIRISTGLHVSRAIDKFFEIRQILTDRTVAWQQK